MAGTSALLEGDAEGPSEAKMITERRRSDLLKVRASRQRDLDDARVSGGGCAGVGSDFGRAKESLWHPRREVREELQSARVATYRTDMLGLTGFYLGGIHVTALPWAASAHRSFALR